MQQSKTYSSPRVVIHLTDDAYGLVLEVGLKDDVYLLRTLGQEPVEVDQFRSVFVTSKYVSVPVYRSEAGDRLYLPMSLGAFIRLLGQVPTSYFPSFVYEPELKDLRDIIEIEHFRNQK